ncbi:hypothetical protein FACS1894181_15350 [Bacteroidia bacterium]|nr:hypothetical protein FACS1894181_15350 [Bacteroidia bacterium]
MNDFQKENMLPPGVISMSRLDLCLEALKSRFAGERKNNDAVRFPLPFGYDEYKTLLAQSADVILERRRENSTFVIDSKNEPVIEQLYLYLKMDDQFSGDIQKGIMLVGKYGSGKTLIMQAMVEMYNTVIHTLHIQYPLLKFIKSSELLETLKEKPLKSFSRLPLVIDEFGLFVFTVQEFKSSFNPVFFFHRNIAV